MKAEISICALAVTLSGCFLSDAACPPWGDNPACESNDDVGEPEAVTGAHSCNGESGACLMSKLYDVTDFDKIAAEPHAGYCDTAPPNDIIASVSWTSEWPCDSWSAHGPVFDGTHANLGAFNEKCGICPLGRGDNADWPDLYFFQDAVQATSPTSHNWGCMPLAAASRTVYNALGYATAASVNNQASSGAIADLECPSGHAEVQLLAMACGGVDTGCTALCNSDADCNDAAYKTYMASVLGPGEPQCAGYPIEQHFGAIYSETPHGCIWVTQSNGGVVPPPPMMGGLVLEDELTFDAGTGVATMTEALIDQVIADHALARMGFDWALDPASGSATLFVKSYSFATLLGVEDGDIVLSVGFEKNHVDVDSLASAYAELRRDGATQIVLERGSETYSILLELE